MFTHVFSAAPILALFLIGYLMRRIHFFKESTLIDIKKFVSYISLPALLFNAFLSLEIQAKHTVMLAVVYLTCVVMILIGKAVARAVSVKSPMFPLMMGGFEMGMFGYALFVSLFGVEHLGKIAFLTIGQTIFVFTILISSVMGLHSGRQSLATGLRRFFTSPVILSIIAGIVVGQFQPVVGDNAALGAIKNLIGILGSMTIPLITITIGYGISISREGLGLSLGTILVRKTFLVVIALAINSYIIDGWLHMESMYRYAMLALALAPPPFVLSVFIHPDDHENLSYINRTISLDCLVSIVCTIVAVTLYR